MPRAVVAMITPHGDPLGRIGEPDIGGQCVYIRELARHLTGCGCTVRAYTRDRSDGCPSRETFAPDAEVVRIPCGPKGFVPKERILPYLDEFADRIASEIAEASILHSHYWDGGYVAHRLRGDQGWFHTTHSIGKLKQRALPDTVRYAYDDRIRIETDVYRGCDHVVALTDLEKAQIADLYGVPDDRILVISPGVAPDVFRIPEDRAALRANLGLPEGPIVFTLGRLDERKGFDLFLRAAGELLRRFEDVCPTFIFSAGAVDETEQEERRTLKRIVAEEHLGDRLRWLDILPPDAVPDFYGAADLFVLPSRYEPFGIVMLEAMACGTPVVATCEGGPSKVIDDGVDGLLVEPTDRAAFADAMATLLRSDELRAAFSARGRAKVEADYGWPIIAQRHRVAYGLPPEHSQPDAQAREETADAR